MPLFTLVLFGKNLFEPVRLALCSPPVCEQWILNNGEQLAAKIAAERTHVLKPVCSLVSVALFDSGSFHTESLRLCDVLVIHRGF
jgi:hypothetical protein